MGFAGSRNGLADIVEVAPPYDHAETTSMIANRAALEAISALAVKRRAGQSVRWRGLPEDERAKPGRREIEGELATIRPREAA